MTISIRLDAETESALRAQSRRRGQPLSEFVRHAIEEKLARDEREVSPYDAGKELFGRYASGEGNRSTDRKRLIAEKLRNKRSEDR